MNIFPVCFLPLLKIKQCLTIITYNIMKNLSHLLFKMTVAAFKVSCMHCFSFLILTFFGIVMAKQKLLERRT